MDSEITLNYIDVTTLADCVKTAVNSLSQDGSDQCKQLVQGIRKMTRQEWEQQCLDIVVQEANNVIKKYTNGSLTNTTAYEEFRSQIGIGLHASLRKFCDSQAADQAWHAIRDMPDQEWEQLVTTITDRALYFSATDSTEEIF